MLLSFCPKPSEAQTPRFLHLNYAPEAPRMHVETRVRGGPRAQQERFMRHLGLSEVNHRVRVPPASLETLERRLDEFMEEELEGDTWQAYSRTFSESSRFAIHHSLAWGEHSCVLWLMAVFMDRARKISLGGLHQYAKQCSAILGRYQAEEDSSGEIRVFKRILVKMGALIPEHQALPLLRDEVYAILNPSNTRFTEEEKMFVYLAWKCAARAMDLQQLNVGDIKEHTLPDGSVVFVFLWIPSARTGPAVQGTGRLKSAKGKVNACVVNCLQYTERVRKFLRGRHGALCRRTTEEMSALLARLRVGLTAHSPKRGALCHLIENGATVEQTTRMARHANPLFDLPPQTRTYLHPAMVHLALLMGTQHATILL